MSKLEDRKAIRLKGANYNSTGIYFITICTLDRRCILSRIVGTGVPDGPSIELTEYGKVAKKYLDQMSAFYDTLTVDRYVIMPNHIHLLLVIKKNGPSRTPVPTIQNSTVSRFVSTFKRFCNKEYGKNIWQYRSNDHIIRSNQDYDHHLKYLLENPLYWYYDELYAEE